ncbi:MAG: hypothetical protein FWD87_02310 [Spirochaetaceae bacterium]|nr:hypothetical protein [Spirochaetaceae bacterium]
MIIEQTVTIPADRRLIIDVPREVPTGRVILTFTPVAEKNTTEFLDASTNEVIAAGDEILNKHIAAFESLAK